MSVSASVLFSRPHHEIATLIEQRMELAAATSIVTGFATPGGLKTISAPIRKRPTTLKAFVVGAATYPAFEALDDLRGAKVPADRLHVHLGYTRPTGGRNNPFARYHPMLHSKIYYMEFSGGEACAFVGSHNVTAFALGGLNGEASILLEGDVHAPQFSEIRAHIDGVVAKSQPYSPGLKEAYAWWFREYLDGLRAEIGIPPDWRNGRTILIFAQADKGLRPKVNDDIYFELPSGIEQINALETEVHLFLFETMPSDPWEALSRAPTADAKYMCMTKGADNERGMVEVDADWRIDASPVLLKMPSGRYRPSTPIGMQQVRATVLRADVEPLEYSFDAEQKGWEPDLSAEEVNQVPDGLRDTSARIEARGGERQNGEWRLVRGLHRREPPMERDQAALRRATPESGSFILVALRKRRRG